jgi:PAS domain S-box-containing protein
MGRAGTSLKRGSSARPKPKAEAITEAALLSWIQQFAHYGVITLDQSFNVRSWNRWMEQHSGMTFEDVAGKNLFALFPDLRKRKLTGHFERALQGESSILSSSLHRYLLPLAPPFRETDLTLMLQTARLAPLFSAGEPCGIIVVIEDVSQRESQAEALEQQHRRDELLSQALAQLLKTEQPRKAIRQLFFKVAEQMDFDTFLVYLPDNESGQVTLEAAGGVEVESNHEFLACPFTALLSGASSEIVVLDSLLKFQPPEYALLHKVGVRAAVLMPLVSNGHNLGLVCFATCTRDTIAPEESRLLATIAEFLATRVGRERTNQQLQKATEALSQHAQALEKNVQERTARLQETVSELETFSYTIAHDLRAPARAMSGFCEVLLEDFADALPEKARMLVQRMARAGGRLESLTRDLLEFSRISRQEIVLAPTEIGPVIEEVAAARLPSLRQAITVCTPLQPVCAHSGLLQHALSNLVDNAVKFVEPGKSPVITISTEPVSHGSLNPLPRQLTFSARNRAPHQDPSHPTEEPARCVRIWVKDQGIGIPPEAHQKIFGIFERGATSECYEGTGIGLAIVARAMQRMGGSCGVESEPGKGSRFWLELPAA